jgi:hypothetical protein
MQITFTKKEIGKLTTHSSDCRHNDITSEQRITGVQTVKEDIFPGRMTYYTAKGLYEEQGGQQTENRGNSSQIAPVLIIYLRRPNM